ncbi:hypothetical protein [Chryseobacterium rhizosphaerae]|uniref:hypothetical protein n=1 Tax=Chryseobacterium rhizosphaerae TaxID=395937 RepID=UPI0028658253|nr:hypothetical protein [Chryseobacterium rhizosphaerae]MDR6546098.1 hypothetical protein [Chryseobacterium rhizosphaerae]
MKKEYYTNKNQQPNGDYEVHESSCRFFPYFGNRIYLGSFHFCQEAVNEAKDYLQFKETISTDVTTVQMCHTS